MRPPGIFVVGVDYPLSPEARYPLALDQILEVVAWRDAGLQGSFVRRERADANPLVVVTDRDSRERTIGFDEPAYAIDFVAGGGFDASGLRLLYRSPPTPPQWLDYDMASARSRVVQETSLADLYPTATSSSVRSSSRRMERPDHRASAM